MFVLLTSHCGFQAPLAGRLLESTLRRNLESPLISRAVVFADGRPSIPGGAEVDVVEVDAHPTYAAMLDYASRHLPGAACIATDGDVRLDDGLGYLVEVDLTWTCLLCGPPGESAASRGCTMVFESPLDGAGLDFGVGAPGAEGCIAEVLGTRGLTVRDVRAHVALGAGADGIAPPARPRPERSGSRVLGSDLEGFKVWGIGLQRTGTASLRRALNVLGFPTMEHFGPWFLVRLEDGALRFDPRINHTFYRGFADNPVPPFFREIDARFPGSKFIYTTRDVGRWLVSAERLFSGRHWGAMPRAATYDACHLLSYGATRFDADRFRRGYERHHREVTEYFSGRADDFLQVDCEDARLWERICPFLGVPIPDVPYPHENRTWQAVLRRRLGRLVHRGRE